MATATADMAPALAEQAIWKPKFNPWLIALTVTLASFMEVLDTSIANVALPHIAGGLSASQGAKLQAVVPASRRAGKPFLGLFPGI